MTHRDGQELDEEGRGEDVEEVPVPVVAAAAEIVVLAVAEPGRLLVEQSRRLENIFNTAVVGNLGQCYKTFCP